MMASLLSSAQMQQSILGFGSPAKCPAQQPLPGIRHNGVCLLVDVEKLFRNRDSKVDIVGVDMRADKGALDDSCIFVGEVNNNNLVVIRKVGFNIAGGEYSKDIPVASPVRKDIFHPSLQYTPVEGT
jgi:hypothetical protein